MRERRREGKKERGRVTERRGEGDTEWKGARETERERERGAG